MFESDLFRAKAWSRPPLSLKLSGILDVDMFWVSVGEKAIDSTVWRAPSFDAMAGFGCGDGAFVDRWLEAGAVRQQLLNGGAKGC